MTKPRVDVRSLANAHKNETPRKINLDICDDDDDDDDNNNNNKLPLGCQPVAVFILHVYKI